jgi:hypothetical protein
MHYTSARLCLLGLPENNQFYRPMVNGRMLLSAGLLEMAQYIRILYGYEIKRRNTKLLPQNQ